MVSCFKSSWTESGAQTNQPQVTALDHSPTSCCCSRVSTAFLPTALGVSSAGSTDLPPRIRSTSRWTPGWMQHVCICPWCYLDQDDLALTNFFSVNRSRRGNKLRNWGWCCTKEVGKSFCRVIKKPDMMTGGMGWTNEVFTALENECESVITGTVQIGFWQKMTPTYVASLRIITWMNRWNLSKNLVMI